MRDLRFAGLLGFLLAFALPGPQPAAWADASIWFEDVRHSPALSDDAVRAAAAYVRHRLLSPQAADDAPLLPSSVRDDFSPRIVFVSASDGLRPARVAVGAARGLLKAADDAIAQLRPADKDPFRPRWLKLDVPATILSQERVDLTRKLEFERSLFGLAFPRQMRIAFIPEELIANDIVNYHQGFFTDQMMAYLHARQPAADTRGVRFDAEKAAIFRFTTQSFFMDRDELVPLYRGHRSFTRITRDQLKASAAAAAAYLTRTVDRYGQFDYIYQPNIDLVPDEYNIVRHFGTILSMADAYEVHKDPDLLAAARRAMDYADASIGQWTLDGRRLPAAIEGGRVTLGANALAAGALARLAGVTGDPKLRERAAAFAQAVAAAQRGDGSFIQYQSFPDGNVFDFDNPYYPGEAIFALMVVQKIDPDQVWVDTAEKAARNLIQVRDKGLSTAKLTQDHWLLYGLNDLYRHRPTPLLLDHAVRVTQAMSFSQHRAPPFFDWLGGYYSPPGSTPAAVRTEGLVAAYCLLRDLGGDARREEAVLALESSILGAAFQLQCQFRPENAMYFKDPQRILGAFRESLTSPNIRIDFVQHNMMGLLNLWRVMEQEKVASFAVPKAQPRGNEPRDPEPEPRESD